MYELNNNLFSTGGCLIKRTEKSIIFCRLFLSQRPKLLLQVPCTLWVNGKHHFLLNIPKRKSNYLMFIKNTTYIHHIIYIYKYVYKCTLI